MVFEIRTEVVTEETTVREEWAFAHEVFTFDVLFMIVVGVLTVLAMLAV